jgi:hypothetical protein
MISAFETRSKTPTQTSGASVRPHPPGRCSDRGHAARNKITALAADLGLSLAYEFEEERGYTNPGTALVRSPAATASAPLTGSELLQGELMA